MEVFNSFCGERNFNLKPVIKKCLISVYKKIKTGQAIIIIET